MCACAHGSIEPVRPRVQVGAAGELQGRRLGRERSTKEALGPGRASWKASRRGGVCTRPSRRA